MLIQQLFNLFHNFLPSFFLGGGKVTTISQTKANFPAFFCMIVFRAQPSRRLRLTGPRARYSQKNDVRNRQKSQKIIIRILSPHPNDNLSAEKNGHGAEKITPCPFFGICLRACGCPNPAGTPRACDKCLRLLSGLRLQRAESGFSIGAIPRKQTHRRYNPLYAAVRKWSCRT